MDTQTKERTVSQRSNILNLLRNSGENGVTNIQLKDIALRYNARIQELYTQGYLIKVEELSNGITKYTLTYEPESKNTKPEDAVDILIRDINNTYGGNIDVGQLRNILEVRRLTVRRKIGTFNTSH